MSTRVSDAVLDSSRRPYAVRVLTEVVDAEVSGKRGISGAAVRAAYGAVRRIDRGVVPRAVDEMLPDFAHVLDAHWSDDVDFAARLESRADEVVDHLLAITDAQAVHSHHAALAVVYHALRSHAAAHVRQALPRLGRAIGALVRDHDGRGRPAAG
ncbi:MAG TPA: hypothetical protein VFT81_06665 [Dermatophilaceae bacterium]|nr:hypothetical protein [Dermatophilaceae bacterium]